MSNKRLDAMMDAELAYHEAIIDYVKNDRTDAMRHEPYAGCGDLEFATAYASGVRFKINVMLDEFDEYLDQNEEG